METQLLSHITGCDPRKTLSSLCPYQHVQVSLKHSCFVDVVHLSGVQLLHLLGASALKGGGTRLVWLGTLLLWLPLSRLGSEQNGD